MDYPCEFSSPLNASGTPPVNNDFWQYSKATCTTPYITLIENGEGQSFYVNQQISYGDFMIITFLLLFLMYVLVRTVWNFLVPVSVRFLTKNDL